MTSLDLKPITELRGIAQAMGLKLDWAWDKKTILEKIDKKRTSSLEMPKAIVPEVISNIADPKEEEIRTALDKYKHTGFSYIIKGDTVFMTYTRIKSDSCTTKTSLRDIVTTARQLMELQ